MPNDEADYTLRISLSGCNLKCVYCRKDDYKVGDVLTNEEYIDMIKAAEKNGIKKVRWTGGEPTIRNGFVDLVRNTKKAGIKRQMLTTNGTVFYRMASELKDAGIDRVNISLDTLKRKKFQQITGKDMIDNVIKSIDYATDLFSIVKINNVLMKDNFEEVIPLIEFARKFENRRYKPVVRFIELVKGGFEGDKEFVEEEYISGNDVVEKIRQEYGPLHSTNIEGDNPMCYYYNINDTGITFGIVPNYSVKYQCAGKNCKKLRVNPTGVVSNCSIYKKFGHNVKGTTFEEKVNVIKHLIEEKKQEQKKILKISSIIK